MAKISDVIKVEWSPASTPFATSPTWVDITDLVLQVNASRGRSGAFDLYQAGQASITLDNTAATIDPTVWYRWRQIRVTATATGPTSNILFKGFVQQITHDQGNAPRSATATIEAEDVLAIIARTDFDGDGVPEEPSGIRIDRVIPAGIPGAWQSLVTGNTLIAEPVGNVPTYDPIEERTDQVATPGILKVNALQHVQDCTEAEAGALYVSRSGVLTFEDRYQLRTRIIGSPTVTFSNTASGTQVKYRQGQLALTPPGSEYRNSVSYVGTSTVPQTAESIPSGFPVDSLSRTLPIARDTQAMANSELFLGLYSQTDVTWPTSVQVHMWPGAQNSLDQVSPLELRRYCQVKFTPVGKSQQTYKVVTEQITHEITPTAWTCTVGFSSADRWDDAWITGITFLVLNDATAGQLNQEQAAY